MSENHSPALIIITSPPASGKTFWISELKEALSFCRILVISPLRALADECRERWGDSVDVMTPEEWLGKRTLCEVVIFDEFHLNFYWGDTFRPQMWDVFYEISQTSTLTFLLTATLNVQMQEEMKYFRSQFDRIEWHDFGNQVLKFKPEAYVRAPSREWLVRLLEEDRSACVKLIFCEFREEVFKLEKHLRSLGFSVVSCVGGEASEMKTKLSHNPFPDFIVCTTVLSHGVNLPEVRKIYFLYPVKNLDFWIQMVARGGRRGASFAVYALESPTGIKWSPVLNHLRVLRSSIRLFFNLRQLRNDLSF